MSCDWGFLLNFLSLSRYAWEERKLGELVVEHKVHRTLNTGTVILIGMHQLKLENKVMLVKVKRLLLN